MVMKLLAVAFALFALQTGTYGSSRCSEGMLCMESFTYMVTNQVILPYFNHTLSLKLKGDKPFIHYMEEACVQNPQEFSTFSATFYQSYGYFIDSVNGLYANWKDNRTYWDFSNATTELNVGVSYYVPTPGDRVLLKFTADPSQDGKRTHHRPMTNGGR